MEQEEFLTFVRSSKIKSPHEAVGKLKLVGTMENKLTVLKRKIELTLEPVIQLLEFKKTELSFSDWIKFLESTKLSIVNNPEQYLGQDLPCSKIIKESVEEIFEGMTVMA